MRGRLLAIAYRLRYYCLGDWRLDKWLISLALLCALLVAPWSLLGGGQSAVPVAGWRAPALAITLLLVAGPWLYGRWAARHDYVIFDGEPAAAPGGEPLMPAEKLPIRATGWFEVEGKSHFFASLPAYWRTFATREHAVMALVHPGRFLAIGHIPDRDVGLWYMFFCPESILELAPGRLTFDGEERLALRLTYQMQPSGVPKPARRPRSVRAARLYLSFESEPALRQAWADMLADSGLAR